MRPVKFILPALLLLSWRAMAQDTTVILENQSVMLREVIVRNKLDYLSILKQIENDTSFYKAFRNLHIIGFSSYNSIRMFNKNGSERATYNSQTKQLRKNGCRTTQIISQKSTGDFFEKDSSYNYTTGEMYASLFFTKGKVCGENNIVAGRQFSTAGKTGIEKHKEQLKMLFFNPGKKIPGIPLIGNKLDLYDDHAHELYNYQLDFVSYKGSFAYVFTITPKTDISYFKKNDIVVDNMTTWFDYKTFDVLARNYSLSYKAGVYDFDVTMEVEMTHVGHLLVPQVMRYKGNFSAAFKKRERGEFTATLFDYSLN
ncbi:MAG: hypothetical protein JSS67_02600 [Bacteroidetes bacterium]|nr:hypothetical protein [Bacteroidota bacterium]